MLSLAAHPRGSSARTHREVTIKTPIPVVFIHGLWLHATSWEPWIELFREPGYAPSAPGLARRPGHRRGGARATPRAIADHGIDDVVEHYAAIIDGLPPSRS